MSLATEYKQEWNYTGLPYANNFLISLSNSTGSHCVYPTAQGPIVYKKHTNTDKNKTKANKIKLNDSQEIH